VYRFYLAEYLIFFMKVRKQTLVWIGIGLLIIALLWWIFGASKQLDDANVSLQNQLENSKELKDVVHSKRNDFTAGTYRLDASSSKVLWAYGKMKGEMPVTSGTLTVLATGRIEGFTVEGNAAGVTVVGASAGDVASILGEKMLNTKKFSTAHMKASTVLPNTVDDAFTVAFSLDGAGKNTSLATGMYVTHGTGTQIIVKGDITLDPKTLGFVDSTENLTISPVYVFK
jgi:nitrogen fixation-related uncharacterized protein